MALAFLLLGLPSMAALGGASLAGYRAPLAAVPAILFQGALWTRRRSNVPDRLALALLLLTLQLILFTAAALTRATTTEYGLWKLQGFCLFGFFPAIIIALNYVSEPNRIRHLLIWFFIMAIVPAALTPHIFFPPAHAAEELYLIGSNPIPVSRGLGMAALLAVVYATVCKPWLRIPSAACAALLILGQFILGERGPILSLLVAFLAIPRSFRGRLYIAGFIACAALVAVAADLRHPNGKFTVEAVESDGRIQIMSAALQEVAEHPVLGAGLGTYYLPDGTREYFHNLEGELLTETGIAGLAIFAGFMLVLCHCRSRSPAPESKFTSALAVFWFIAAQVSGDIVSNSMVWVSSILWACSQFSEERRRVFTCWPARRNESRREAVGP